MKKIITYGTFDLFHRGHYNILKRAKEYGDYLVVGVTSESFDIERGKLGVRDSLAQRIKNVQETGFADEIIIEEFQGQKIQDVQKYEIDAIVIGSDWYGKFDYLKPYCEVVYLERTKNISSTQIRLENQTLSIGVITDSLSDSDFIHETKFVSGVHVDRVFAENADIAKKFCESKELNESYTDFDSFIDGTDAVYVNVEEGKRYEYIKSSLLAGKHVISKSPMAQSEDQLSELINIARSSKTILIDCMTLSYLHAFNQMVWMIESGVIGKVISFKCAISNIDEPSMDKKTAYLYSLYTVSRICGNNFLDFSSFSSKYDANRSYNSLLIKSDNGTAFVEIGENIPLDCRLTVFGESGKVVVPDDWWNTGYFEISFFESKTKKRYSYNYDGNGMRYILRELLIMLREKSIEPLRYTYKEALSLYKILGQTFENQSNGAADNGEQQ